MRRSFFLAALLTLFSPVARDALAADQDTKITGTFGTDYSNGSYGTNRNTDVLLGLSTVSLAALDEQKKKLVARLQPDPLR